MEHRRQPWPHTKSDRRTQVSQGQPSSLPVGSGTFCSMIAGVLAGVASYSPRARQGTICERQDQRPGPSHPLGGLLCAERPGIPAVRKICVRVRSAIFRKCVRRTRTRTRTVRPYAATTALGGGGGVGGGHWGGQTPKFHFPSEVIFGPKKYEKPVQNMSEPGNTPTTT